MVPTKKTYSLKSGFFKGLRVKNTLLLIPFIFLLCLLPGYIMAQAPSKIELLKQKKQLLQEIEATNKILSETEKNKKISIKQLRALTSQIQSRQSLIQNINSQVNTLDHEITDNRSNVNSLQKSLSKLKREYAAMIRYAYINQGAYKRLSFVFASSSFNQAYKRLKSLQQFSNYRQEQVEAIQSTENKINSKIKILDENKMEKARMLSEKEREKKQLDKVKVVEAKKVKELQSQSQDLQKRLDAAYKKRARVENAIQAAIRKEIEEARLKEEKEKEKANNSGNKTPVLEATKETKLSNDFLENKGRLPWPVSSRGKITAPFGIYSDPIQPKVKIDSKGISFETGTNATVRSVFSGTVSLVASRGGVFFIVIKHGEYYTAYSNLQSVSVHKDDKVVTKQSIGVVANDPDDGSILTFSVLKGTVFLNPMSWLIN